MSARDGWRLEPQLAEYRAQHEEIRARYLRLLDTISAPQFEFAPGPGRWSIGQNIEHLRLAAEDQLVIVENLIGRGWAEGIRGAGPFDYGPWGDRYIRFLEPPYRVRVPAKPRYVPKRRVAYVVAVARYLESKRRILDLIEVANGLDLAKLAAPLPDVDGWSPSLSLGQWFGYVAAHERRHLWQIDQIRAAEGYPHDGSAAAA